MHKKETAGETKQIMLKKASKAKLLSKRGLC